MILGILIGSVLGIILGLVPGFNIGFVFLFSLTIPDPEFACGLIIGIDATSASVKALNILSGVNEEELPDGVSKVDDKVNLAWCNIVNYTTGKILGCFLGAVLLFYVGESSFKIELFHKGLAIGYSLIIWGALINQSKNKKLAGIISVIIITVTLLTIQLNIPSNMSMFVLVSAMFVGGSLKNLKKTKIKVSKTETKEVTQNPRGILAGMLSAFLWGLPVSAVCKGLKEEKDSIQSEVAMNSVANGISSAVGLTILMVTGGARSAAATSAATLDIQFNMLETIGILGISALLSVVAYLLFEDIMKIYILIYNCVPSVLNIVIVIGSISYLTYVSSGWFIVLGITSLLIQKLIRLAEAPKELSLIAISILPLISIF